MNLLDDMNANILFHMAETDVVVVVVVVATDAAAAVRYRCRTFNLNQA